MKTKTKPASPRRSSTFAGTFNINAEVNSACAIEGQFIRDALSQYVKENQRSISLRHEDKCSRFKELLWDWKTDVKFTSSSEEIVLHPAYQQIIGLGAEIVPLLLNELRRDPDYLFHALFAITGENPISPENYGDVDAMTSDWLAWGRQQHYIS